MGCPRIQLSSLRRFTRKSLAVVLIFVVFLPLIPSSSADNAAVTPSVIMPSAFTEVVKIPTGVSYGGVGGWGDDASGGILSYIQYDDSYNYFLKNWEAAGVTTSITVTFGSQTHINHVKLAFWVEYAYGYGETVNVYANDANIMSTSVRYDSLTEINIPVSGTINSVTLSVYTPYIGHNVGVDYIHLIRDQEIPEATLSKPVNDLTVVNNLNQLAYGYSIHSHYSWTNTNYTIYPYLNGGISGTKSAEKITSPSNISSAPFDSDIWTALPDSNLYKYHFNFRDNYNTIYKDKYFLKDTESSIPTFYNQTTQIFSDNFTTMDRDNQPHEVLPIKIRSIAPRTPGIQSTLAALGYGTVSNGTGVVFPRSTYFEPSRPDVQSICITLATTDGTSSKSSTVLYSDLVLSSTVAPNKYSTSPKFFQSLGANEVECYLNMTTLWKDVLFREFDGELRITIGITDFAGNYASSDLFVVKQRIDTITSIRFKFSFEAGSKPMDVTFDFFCGRSRNFSLSYELLGSNDSSNNMSFVYISTGRIQLFGPGKNIPGAWHTFADFITPGVWASFIHNATAASNEDLVQICIEMHFTYQSIGGNIDVFGNPLIGTGIAYRPTPPSMNFSVNNLEEVNCHYLLTSNTSTPSFTLSIDTQSENILDFGYRINYEAGTSWTEAYIGSLTGIPFTGIWGESVSYSHLNQMYLIGFRDTAGSGYYRFQDPFPSTRQDNIAIGNLSFDFNRELFGKDGSYDVVFWMNDSAKYYLETNSIRIYRDTDGPMFAMTNIGSLNNTHFNSSTGKDHEGNDFVMEFKVFDANLHSCGFQITNLTRDFVGNYTYEFDAYTNNKSISWSYIDSIGNFTGVLGSGFFLRYFIKDMFDNIIWTNEAEMCSDNSAPAVIMEILNSNTFFIDETERFSSSSPEIKFTVLELSDFSIQYQIRNISDDHHYGTITALHNITDGNIICTGTGLREYVVTLKINPTYWAAIVDSNGLELTIAVTDVFNHAWAPDPLIIVKDTASPHISNILHVMHDEAATPIPFENISLHFEYFDENYDSFKILLQIRENNWPFMPGVILPDESIPEKWISLQIQLVDQHAITFSTKYTLERLSASNYWYNLVVEVDDASFGAFWNDTRIDRTFSFNLTLVDELANSRSYNSIIARDRLPPTILCNNVTEIFNDISGGYMRFGDLVPFFNFFVNETNFAKFEFYLSYFNSVSSTTVTLNAATWFLQSYAPLRTQSPTPIHFMGYLDPYNFLNLTGAYTSFKEYWLSIPKPEDDAPHAVNITLRITDHVGHFNETTIITNVIWDRTAPVLQLHESMFSDQIYGNIPPSYRFTVIDKSIKAVYAQDNITYLLQPSAKGINASGVGVWSYLRQYDTQFWDQIPHGIHLFRIIAIDYAGNTVSSAPFIITKDLEGPVINIMEPAKNEGFKAPPRFTITVNDLSIIQQIYYRINGKTPYPVDMPATPYNQLTLVIPIPVSVWDQLAAPNENYTFTFYAVDKLGNEGWNSTYVTRLNGPLTHDERGDGVDLNLFLYMPRPAMYICISILVGYILFIYYTKKIRKPKQEHQPVVNKPVDLSPQALFGDDNGNGGAE